MEGGPDTNSNSALVVWKAVLILTLTARLSGMEGGPDTNSNSALVVWKAVLILTLTAP